MAIDNINDNYDNLTNFNGFRERDQLELHKTGMGFVFITRPILFINPVKPNDSDTKGMLAYENMCADPVFNQFIKTEALNEADKFIASQLSYKTDASSMTSSYFIPLFTNMAKDLATSDRALDTTETHETVSGWKFINPTNSVNSQNANSISINMTETANLDIIKTLTLWVNYIDNVADGTFYANPDMIKNGMLDYVCSIYYFALAPDGRTIRYYTKYTGVYPTNVPYGALGFNKGELAYADLNVTFNYMMKEDMNPKILEDFNRVSLHVSEVSSDNLGYDFNPNSQSALLNKELLKSGAYSAKVRAGSRDPLVIYEPANGDIDACFKLSFGSDTQINSSFEYQLVKDQNLGLDLKELYSLYDDFE